MKGNELKITGKKEIILSTPKGTMTDFYWDGEKLVHSTGKTMAFNAAVTAEIEEATRNSHNADYEIKYGFEIKDGDREGWEFSHVENDAHGVYVRRTVARKTISVFFAKEDLVH